MRRLLPLLVLLTACRTMDPERAYYAGRFDQAIANASPARQAKYMAMRAFVMGGDFGEAITTAQRAAAAAHSAEERAEALTWEAFALYAQTMTSGSGDYGPALQRAEEALALRRSAGDPRGIVEAMFYRGLIAERQRDSTTAMKLYREALAMAQKGGHSLEESYLQRHLAFLEQGAGDLTSARERLQRSYELRKRIAFHVFLPFSILSLAELDTEIGHFARADRGFAEARQMAAAMGFRRLEALVDLGWGALRLKEGRTGEARELWLRAGEISRRIGYQRGVELAQQRLSSIR